MYQRNMNTNGRARPLQASTNIIHTKIPKRIDNVVHDRVKLPEKNKLRPVASGPQKKETLSTSKRVLKKSDITSSQTSKGDENDVAHNTREDELKPPSTTPVKTTDENDLSEYIKNAYNPLNDVHPFDEELYQKVLKLKLADDGLPTFELDEPFDF